MSEKMSISNLNKNAGVTTGSGISYQTITSDDNITTLENPNIKPARTVADLSSLPQKEDTHEGIIIKESIEDEVFGEGGVFEEYLKEARKEREEMDAAIDAHNQMVAAELGEEVPDEITDEDVIRSTEAINNKENPLDEIETEVEDPSDYVDPLERELEAEEEEEIAINNKFKQSMSNIDAVQEQTKLSNNSIANTIKSEDLGQGVNYNIDEEDLLDLDEDEEDDNDDANLKELQSSISDKIAHVNKKFDLKSIKFTNQPISANNAIEAASKKTVDWALFSSKMHFGMSEFSGTDISTLGSNTGLNQYSTVYNRYKLFLDHMVGENKPKDVETFVKSVSFLDNDDLYGGVYVANFNGSNYIPYDCPKCKYTFLSENIPIEDMYSFDKPEEEKTFRQIREEQFYQLSDLYVSEAVQITDNFIFVFREPSIYSIVFEPALLDDKFTNKYRDIISVVSYIDNIYLVKDGVAQPIGYRKFNNNKMKNVKSRIIEYAKIINSLSPDEYNVILAYLASINNQKTGMKWKLPECTCPKCGTTIKERETTAEQLVFMRHQLAALAITSLK